MDELPLIPRMLDLRKGLEKKSYLLLGPRQTGKSSLIAQQFPQAKIYNLLLLEDFKRLSFDPTLIRKELKPHDRLVVIDEVQRLPELLDEVHYLIEKKSVRFLLTGSSARKLKAKGVNLLGGRARLTVLHPFNRHELGEHFSLDRVINRGLIPGIYFSEDAESDLDAYLGLYLEQEIAQEGLVRSLPTFSRFLEVAALCNGEQVNHSSVASDAQIPRTTIHEYFKILEDTLIGYFLPAWGESKKRKPIATPKFYFFDWGIVRKLQDLRHITAKSELFGKAFETYMFHEIRTYCDYRQIKDLAYWRTQQQDEVDFIIDSQIAVEIKATGAFKAEYAKSLVRLREEGLLKRYYLVYTGPDLHLEEFPWLKVRNFQTFLDELYA